MKIEKFCVGPVQTNCYFVINDETKEMFIVDPGDSARRLAEEIQTKEYKAKGILLTHGHFDHAGAAVELARLLQVKVYAHEAEQETLEKPEYNRSVMLGKTESYVADIYLKDEEELTLAGFDIKVLHTPGHTVGGCCYYISKEAVVFSGDTLFCESVGRTDFPKGSMSQLVRSVKEKLLILPEATTVYPGHMDPTSILAEKQWNPYLL